MGIKKLLALAAVMGLSMFVGCGGGDSDSGSTDTTPTAVVLNDYETAIVGHWVLVSLEVFPKSDMGEGYVQSTHPVAADSRQEYSFYPDRTVDSIWQTPGSGPTSPFRQEWSADGLVLYIGTEAHAYTQSGNNLSIYSDSPENLSRWDFVRQ